MEKLLCLKFAKLSYKEEINYLSKQALLLLLIQGTILYLEQLWDKSKPIFSQVNEF